MNIVILLMAAQAASPTPTPTERICRTFNVPIHQASTLRKDVKVCQTKAEWDLIAARQALNGTSRPIGR